MRFRCPFCRRQVALDGGAAGYLGAQIYAHLDQCPKRPDKEPDQAMYTRAMALADKALGGGTKRKRG
ncbi:MAG TPA: hypothetical protein VF618_09375 [Thermoanaerobaculia bacterium]